MPSNVVKLKPETYERVKARARAHGATMQDVIARGMDALDRLEFAAAFRQDFELLRAGPEAWSREESERELWESTVSDGLD